MTELLSAAQMRAIETAAISSGRASGLELMERAGMAVVEAIVESWPELGAGPHRAAVLCGPGNNGGDGYVIARLLKESGWQVGAFLYGDPDALPPDARANFDRWGALQPHEALSDLSLGTVTAPPDLVVDALFGTGLTRPIDGEAGFLLGNLENLRAQIDVKCVAVDLPSGLCSDSGKGLGLNPVADLTVTFHAEKLGHRLGLADAASGRLVVKDIGLPARDEEGDVSDVVTLVQPPAPALLRKSGAAQKYDSGHALVLTGAAGQSGAARLAARAALRVGAGLVTLGVPNSAHAEVAAQITALMLARVPDADALSELLWDTRLNALCLGPGLGATRHGKSLVAAALPLSRATVLDADALTMFKDDPDALIPTLHEKCVLTPHGGEFARLFPDISRRLTAQAVKGPAYSKVDATRAAAARAGCTVLFKGADTVIAGPDGRCVVHSAHYDRAAPWLATAGSGDVLAGFITGLMARGLDPFQAAETAAWLHGQCALDFGPGLIAEDLPESLPGVLRNLGV